MSNHENNFDEFKFNLSIIEHDKEFRTNHFEEYCNLRKKHYREEQRMQFVIPIVLILLIAFILLITSLLQG